MSETEERRKPQWRHQALAESLHARILSGEFPIGSALPTERDIAVAEKVSRATVREALRFLESHGMIRRRQGSGTVVIALEPQRMRMPINSIEALLSYPADTEVEVQAAEALPADDPAFIEADLDVDAVWRRITFQRCMRGASAPVSHIEIYIIEEYADVEADIPEAGGAVFKLVEKRFDVHPSEAVIRTRCGRSSINSRRSR